VNVDVGIWGKLTRVVTFLLLAAGILAVVVWYLPLMKQNERMRQQLVNLDSKIRREEEVGKGLKVSIDSMSDPKTVERLAREKLSFAKTGETVFRFETSSTNAPALGTAAPSP